LFDGNRVGWFRVDWNFHGSLHEGGIWREGSVGN